MIGGLPTYGAAHNPKTLKTSLVACWEFDETTGTTLNDVHGTYNMTHGTNVAINQSDCKMTKSADYNGIYDSTNTAVSSRDGGIVPSTIAAAHSINVWCKREGLSNVAVGTLMGRYHSTGTNRVYTFYMYDSDNGTVPNRLRGQYYDNNSTPVSRTLSYDPGSDIWTGNWMMCTYTRNGDAMKLYVNGEQVASGNGGGTGTMNSVGGTVADDMIGGVSRSSSSPDNIFNGKIDQTAMWSKALSPEEVKFLYNQGSGAPYLIW